MYVCVCVCVSVGVCVCVCVDPWITHMKKVAAENHQNSKELMRVHQVETESV